MAVVQRAIDGRVQQEAAFAVLRGYIDLRTEGNWVNIDPARTRWHEYTDALKTYSVDGTPAAIALFKKGSFKIDTLAKFISPESLEVYRAIPSIRDLLASDPEVQAADKAHKAATDASKRSLQEDLGVARRNHVDLSVFGVQLGEPLNLPFCPTDGRSPLQQLASSLFGGPVAETCVSREGPSLFQSTLQMRAEAIPWISTGVLVKLAQSRCPSWAAEGGCAVMLNVEDGVPVGAVFNTAGVESRSTIEGALRSKYHAAGSPGALEVSCRNRLTGIALDKAKLRSWQLPGLTVVYSPIVSCSGAWTSFNETQGEVLVELRKVRHRRDEAQRREQENEPKM